MPWLSTANDFAGTVQQLPALAAAHQSLYQSLSEQAAVPVTTLELCRLRLALLHGASGAGLAPLAALSDKQRDSLAQWPDNPVYTATDRACLAFAEVYAMDPGAITDAQADAVKDCIGERGLLVLIEALGVLDGAQRLALLWQLDSGER